MKKDKDLHPLDKIAIKHQEKELSYFDDIKDSVDFFELRPACDTKETGPKFPQIKRAVGGNWDIMDKNSVYNQITSHKSPEIIPDFGEFELYKLSKPSDFLSHGMMGPFAFIVSPKVRDIFLSYNLGNYWCFDVNVKSNNKLLPYNILHFNNDFSDSIRFPDSTFYTQEGLIGTNKKDVRFNSRDEYDSFQKEIYERDKDRVLPKTNIRAKELFIENDKNLDILTSWLSGIDFFISRRLAEDLKNKGVTGASTKPTKKLHLNP
jgi:hypothetical protein